MISIKKLKNKAQENLSDLGKRVDQLNNLEWGKFIFNLNSEGTNGLLRDVGDYLSNKESVVYAFRCQNYEEEIFDFYKSVKLSTKNNPKSLALRNLRKSFGDLNVCKINKYNSKCLYVGSGHKFISRLKNHLGIGKSNSTYSMHLNKVLHKKKWRKQVSLELNILKISSNDDDVKQLLEDTLWNELKPSFGKFGGK